MRASCLSAIPAAVVLALVAACGAPGETGGQGMAPDTAQDSTPDIDRITTVIEESGFTCEVKERHPDRFVQVLDCRSDQDKYRKLIASEWKDAKARDAMYENRMPGMCGSLGLKDQVRWSTSGNWALVAGGGTDKDATALDQASAALGFELHSVACR